MCKPFTWLDQRIDVGRPESMSCVFQALPSANRKRYFSFFQALAYFSFAYLPCKIVRKVKLHARDTYTYVKVLKGESEASFFRKRSV